MVRLEDGERLSLAGAGVVGALGGLDGLGDLCGAAVVARGTLALGVGGGRVEGRGHEGGGEQEEGGELHLEALKFGKWVRTSVICLLVVL